MDLPLGEYIGRFFAPDSFSHLRNSEMLNFQAKERVAKQVFRSSYNVPEISYLLHLVFGFVLMPKAKG